MSGVNCDVWCRGGTAMISEVGRSKTQDIPPDQGTNTEYDPLLKGQPVEYIKHVGRYVSSSRNASHEARGSADNPLEAAQTHNRETNVECGAVCTYMYVCMYVCTYVCMYVCIIYTCIQYIHVCYTVACRGC